MPQRPTYTFSEIVDLILQADHPTLVTIIELLMEEPDRYTPDQGAHILTAVKARRELLGMS